MYIKSSSHKHIRRDAIYSDEARMHGCHQICMTLFTRGPDRKIAIIPRSIVTCEAARQDGAMNALQANVSRAAASSWRSQVVASFSTSMNLANKTRKGSVDADILRNAARLGFIEFFAIELRITMILTFRMGQGQM